MKSNRTKESIEFLTIGFLEMLIDMEKVLNKEEYKIYLDKLQRLLIEEFEEINKINEMD